MLRLRRPNKNYLPQEILNFVNIHESQMTREMKLRAYYEGKNDILKTTKADGKSNIQASHPFASKITNSFVGYFASKPIRTDYEDEDVMALVDDFFKYNDADKQLTRLATDACIYGEAVEMLFIDKKGNVRFAPVATTEIIVIVGNDILEEPHHVIRHWKVENNNGYILRYIEVYDSKQVEKFHLKVEKTEIIVIVGNDILEEPHHVIRHWKVENNNGYILRYIEVYDSKQVEKFHLKVEKNDETDEEVIQVVNPIIEEHLFNDVPFVFYKFAHDGLGIFERIIPLIDSYDRAVSESLNLMADLSDALLLITGVDLDHEKVDDIKNLRLLHTATQEVRVEYITKDAPTNDEVKKRLKDDIYSLCSVVNLDDEKWGTATSGTSLRMRLASMEFLAGVRSSSGIYHKRCTDQ